MYFSHKEYYTGKISLHVKAVIEDIPANGKSMAMRAAVREFLDDLRYFSVVDNLHVTVEKDRPLYYTVTAEADITDLREMWAENEEEAYELMAEEMREELERSLDNMDAVVTEA